MKAESIHLFTPEHWKSYRLLDSGNKLKLEQFGEYVLIRPEPQALWKPSWDEKKWKQLAHAQFIQKGSHSGTWNKLKPMNDKWKLAYDYQGLKLSFNLSLTSFKHVGVFPEQAYNWDFIYTQCQKIGANAKVLNLFAYTGGASLAAKAAGADVVHVDSVKQVINWSRQNMETSGLEGIRWVVEDALKFVKREARRGNRYHGIILDPPAYGIGAGGERWKLEEQINELMQDVASILHKEQYFLVMNMYSLGLSAMIIDNIIHDYFPHIKHKETGELYLLSEQKIKLPLGILCRFSDLG
jgi:23S rRNA (cytosine1962-C5)-methyltransferase